MPNGLVFDEDFAVNRPEFVKNSGLNLFSTETALLFGLSDAHVLVRDGVQLQTQVLSAFDSLVQDAHNAGLDLVAASSFRSFERQALIFNGKLRGDRIVLDDNDCVLDREKHSISEWLYAILRFSALPGTSRHHWGTDLDVFDRAALNGDLQLTVSESETLFADLHAWLDERMAQDKSYGFFRPYASDRGGVSPEPWHLSYAPLALAYENLLTPTLWREMLSESGYVLDHSALIDRQLEPIFARFVAVPRGWCPDHYRSGQTKQA
jgi:LAS superfamily LD-carboxypeptidase LdcB